MADAVAVSSSEPRVAGEADGRPACLYCGGVACAPLFAEVRDRLHYVEGAWSFVRCTACGSAMLCPQPLESELPSFYPPVYSFQLDAREVSPARRLLNWLEYRLFHVPQYRAQVRRVARTIDVRAGSKPRLLDIGCGRGLRLLAFQSQGFQCVGMDFQPEVVAQVERDLGIPAVCCDVRGLHEHFPPESLDVITAFFLIEHVTDVVEVLRACRRLLKPGGWLVGDVPLVDSVQGSVFGGKWSCVTEAPRHLSLPSHEGLRRACARAGYDSVLIHPDSCVSCAWQMGLSVVPEASFGLVYGSARWKAVLLRLLGGLVTLAAIPVVLIENHLLARPANGLVFARNPGG